MDGQEEHSCRVHVVVLGQWDESESGRVERAAQLIGSPEDYQIHRLRSGEELARFADDPPPDTHGAVFCVLTDDEWDWNAAWLVARLRTTRNTLVLSFSMCGQTSATRDLVACFPFKPQSLPLVMRYLRILITNGLRQEGHIALDWNDVTCLLGDPGAANLYTLRCSAQEWVPSLLQRRLPVWSKQPKSHVHVHVTADYGLLGRTLKATMASIRASVHPDSAFAMSLQYEEHKGMRVVVAIREAF